MYKFIMVDNEILELNLMSRIIDWTDYNLILVKTFDNGFDALSYIKEHNDIELVFTDIRMPNIDGCELARLIKEYNPNIFVVFISAYSDFEYAHIGLKYQVVDYILKPIDLENIKETCENIRQKLNTKNAEQDSIDMPFLKKQQVLYEYLTSDMSVTQFCEELKTCGIIINEKKCPTSTVKIVINNFNEYLKNEWKYSTDRLYSAIINFLQFADYVCIPINYSFNEITVMFFSLSLNFDEFSKSMSELENNLKQKLDITILADLNVNVLSISFDPDSEKEHNKSYFSLPDTNAVSQVGTSRVVKRAIEYINKNYMKDITLSEIAEYVYLTPYHFSKVFKNTTGEKYIDYLNRIKITKAKELLANTEMKITDIYRHIGYNSKNHFYKMFKLFCGITPQEYRNYNYKRDDK